MKNFWSIRRTLKPQRDYTLNSSGAVTMNRGLEWAKFTVFYQYAGDRPLTFSVVIEAHLTPWQFIRWKLYRWLRWTKTCGGSAC